MKREEELGEKSQAMYLDFSKKLNDLINLYFRATKGEDIELKIAGNARDRNDMMPLLYLDADNKAELSDYMIEVLEQYTQGNPGCPRMKPLDVVKVLMGIMSERDCVKQFKFDGKFWAKLHEYSYQDLMTLADEVVTEWYMKNIARVEQGNKKRKLN